MTAACPVHDKSVSSGLDKFAFCRSRLETMPTTAKGEKKFCSLRIIAVIVMEIDVFSIVWNVCFFVCLACFCGLP